MKAKLMNKALAWLMTVSMLLSLMPGMAFAAEDAAVAATGTSAVAKVGNTEYATIDEAIAAWTNGTTLTLLADVTLSDVIKLSSTEYHILDLGTYTMTAAKNKDAIQYVVNGRSSAGYALDIKADATNPGGITATSKTIVSHIKPSSGAPSKDRPITRFYGGIFNASYVVKQGGSGLFLPGAGYTGASAPYFQFYGGEYNGTIYTNRSQNQFHGGTFNGSMQMSVDSSAYTLVAGGTFKNLSNSMGSALNSDKFTIGSSKGANNGSVCIDENGNYVITTTTPAAAEASVASNYNSNNYFYYSTVNTNGMYYEDVYDALEANTTGEVTVFTNELDMTQVADFEGTIVVPEGKTITITNAPENLKVTNPAGDELKPSADGTYGGTEPATLTLSDFVNAVIAANGNYDGQDATFEITPASGDARTETVEGLPNRLQKYSNPEVYYAQYQRFAELTDVSISNVNFVFVPAAVTVVDPWNTAGATTTADNINGELQLMNAGSVTLTGCTFDKMSVSPINATSVTINDCEFNGLDAYAIKDITASTVSVTDSTFTDCSGAFWMNAAPATLTVTGNEFVNVGRRGAIQFSAAGDYTNTAMDVTGNSVTGGAFLWQLNPTVTYEQVSAILDTTKNTYETAYVGDSIEPAGPDMSGPDMSGDVVNVTADQAQDVLDGKYGDITGKTINFTESIDTVLVLGRPTKYADSNTVYVCGNGNSHSDESKTFTNVEDFVAHYGEKEWHTTPHYTRTVSDVTFTANEGVTVAGLTASTGHVVGPAYDYVRDIDYTSGSVYYCTMLISDITFEGVSFTGRVDVNTSDADTVFSGLTFADCTFTTGGTAADNGPAVRYYNEANNGKFTDITVENCTFTDCYQGVYTHHVSDVTVTGCTFDTIGHNAVAMQSHGDTSVDLGTVVIAENYFTGVNDRVIRMNNVAGGDIAINNNVMVNCGDEAGQMIKATAVADGTEVDLENNYWDGEDAATAVSNLTVPAAVGIAGGSWTQDVKAYVAPGETVTINGESYTAPVPAANLAEVNGVKYTDLQEAITEAAKTGATVTLLSDVVLSDTLTMEKNVVLDGDGKTIKAAADFTGVSAVMAGNSGWSFGSTAITIKNTTFTGFETSHGVLRIQGVSADVTNCTFTKNTQTGTGFGIVNYNFAAGTVSGCTFTENTCAEVVDINSQPASTYVPSEAEVFTVKNNTFADNTVTSTAVVYYAKGAGVTFSENTFTENAMTTTGNAGVLYFSEGANSAVTGNLFQDNSIANAATRSGVLLLESGITVTDNAFVGNVLNAEADYMATVLNKADAGTPAIDLSGNYWGGGEPDYATVKGAPTTVEDYYTTYEDGTLGGLTEVATAVAKIGDVEYTSLEAAAADAKAGDEIVLIADVTEDVTFPDDVIFNGNGYTVNGNLYAEGDITFKGITKAKDFDAEVSNTTVNIGEGACLELTGPDRLVIGHGATFNITGTIADAKTANTADLTPSLIMPGASFTGAGVTFNVTNAYIKTTASYCSSSKSASGTFDFNITNSVWEQFGKLAFEEQSTAATVNFDLKDSVLTTTSHLVFGVSKGEIVIDNSNVNVGASKQMENCSTMTVKNGSVVNGIVATSSNAKNPGTLIVDNATYAVTGEFSGSDLGTGTLIVKKGASFTAGSITKADIVVDATGMAAGDEINITANLSKLAGTLAVTNNDGLTAKIVDGKIVLAIAPVAKIGDVEYATLEDAFKAATSGCVIDILADVTVDYKWDSRYTGAKFTVPVTINGNGHTLTFTGVVNDGYNYYSVFRFENDATVKNLTVDMKDAQSEFQGRFRAIAAKGNLTVDGCTFIGNGSANNTRAIIFGEGGTADSLANVAISVTNSEFNGWRQAIGDNESGKTEVKTVVISGNTMTDAGVNVSASDSITFTDNTVEGKYVKLVSYTENNTLDVTATGNTLTANADTSKNCNYTNAGGTVVTQEDFVVYVKPVAEVNGVEFATLQEAIAAANNGDTVKLLADVELSGIVSVPNGKGLTIDGAGHKITPAADFATNGNGAALVLADGATDYSTVSYTLKGLTFEGFSGLSRVVRANFGDIAIENCQFNNNTVTGGVITSSFANLTVDNCAFDGNTVSGYGVIDVGSDVSKGTEAAANITNSSFTNNNVAFAVLFLFSDANATGNYFSGNTHTGTAANAAAVLAGPYAGNAAYTINITGNAFANAMSKEGVALPAVFAEDHSNLGNVFDISANYWDGIEPAQGAAYQTAGTVTGLKMESYYTTYEDGVLSDLVEIATSVAQVGEEKFASVLEALKYAIENSASKVELLADSREVMPTDVELLLKADLAIVSATGEPVAAKFYNVGTNYDFIINTAGGYDECTFTIGENVTFQLEDRVIWSGYYGNNVDVIVEGTLAGNQFWQGADTHVESTGALMSTGEAMVLRRGATLFVDGGKVDANYFSILAGSIFAENGAQIDCGAMWIANTGSYAGEGNVNITIWDSTLNSSGNLTSATSHAAGVNIDIYESTVAFNNFDGYGASTLDANTLLQVNGENAEASFKDMVNNGTVDIYDGGSMTASKFTNNSVVSVEEDSSFAAGNADANVARIGANYYGTLAVAIAVVTEGETITLLADIAASDIVTIDKAITLDLNGKTLAGEIKLAVTGATVSGAEGMNVTSAVEGYQVVYANGVYSLAVISAAAPVEIYTDNMTLSNSLAMSFYVEQKLIEADKDYFIRVTKTYADGRGDKVVEYVEDEWETSGSYYRVTFTGIAAKEMSDEIDVQVFYTDGTVAGPVWTTSPQIYADYMLDTDEYGTGKWATLFVDMLNYGASAQKYFHYNEGDLANANLTEAQKALATQTVVAEDQFAHGTMVDNDNLVLRDNISLKMYIKGASEGMYAKVWFNKNYDGSKVEKTVPFEQFEEYDATYRYVSVNELAVADGFQLVTCEIYDAEGNLLDSGADSVASYLKAMADYDTDEPLWMDTLKFIASAKATVASKG